MSFQPYPNIFMFQQEEPIITHKLEFVLTTFKSPRLHGNTCSYKAL